MSRVCAWCRTVPLVDPRARFLLAPVPPDRVPAASSADRGRRVAHADGRTLRVRRPALPGLSARYYGATRPSRARWTTRPSSRRWRPPVTPGWALSTSARSCATCSPLPPDGQGVRLDEAHRGAPRTRGIHSTWEPVIVVGGRQRPRACGTGSGDARPRRRGDPHGAQAAGLLRMALRPPGDAARRRARGPLPGTRGGHPGLDGAVVRASRRPVARSGGDASLSAPMVTRRQGRGGRVARVPARRWLPSVAHAVGESSRSPRRRPEVPVTRACTLAAVRESSPRAVGAPGGATRTWRAPRPGARPRLVEATRTATTARHGGGEGLRLDATPNARGRTGRRRAWKAPAEREVITRALAGSPARGPWRCGDRASGRGRWTTTTAWTAEGDARCDRGVAGRGRRGRKRRWEVQGEVARATRCGSRSREAM